MDTVVTRIPPSPTGHLHIGTARTALYNFLFARKHGGKFIFRSEDTDRTRSTKGFEQEILEGLKWLSLTTDSFSRQSERATIYRGYLERAIEDGHAYISKEESRATPGEVIEVVRLRNQNKVIIFRDEIRGDISFDTTELGDVVIARNLDDALYHFAVVVDDFDMGVTHVIRGEDHISNTPRQILIQEAIGAPRPIYAHLPLILAPNRSKMSKRDGAVALYEYRDKGYLPEALINYLALLGWNPGTAQELFSLDELVNAFDLTKIQKSGAIFDIEKLNWFNREYLKVASDEVFVSVLRTAVQSRFGVTEIRARTEKQLIRLLRERSTIISEVTLAVEAGEYDFFFTAPEPNLELIKWKKDGSVAGALPRLTEVARLLSMGVDSEDPESIKGLIWDYAEKEGRGEVLWPLRTTLTGMERSPDPFTVIAGLGIPESVRRIQRACDKIGG